MARSTISEDQLLKTRLCDLRLSVSASPKLSSAVAQIQSELQLKGVHFTPYFWLSTDWFCPDRCQGIAIPFYLADPQLLKLEMKWSDKVEGKNRKELLKLLRHEVGHAIEHAFQLTDHPLRIKYFGSTEKPYPQSYQFKKYSRHFVRHLGEGYAQSHPDEDFAETFAVWLDPGSQWQDRYAHWPVINKLNVMNRLMKMVSLQRPVLQKKYEVEPLRDLKMTLSQYYDKKKESPSELIMQTHRKLLRHIGWTRSEVVIRKRTARACSMKWMRKQLSPLLPPQLKVYEGEALIRSLNLHKTIFSPLRLQKSSHKIQFRNTLKRFLEQAQKKNLHYIKM